ncbi:hypothetical protein [Hathewaya proteolytica]|uniref:hypothetical protein n=1 Tax=Hathewaya proteolytica TaxID=29365 RepID=UPI0009333F0E|nr:hypothetical protein [Hathewaya proteolytica]
MLHCDVIKFVDGEVMGLFKKDRFQNTKLRKLSKIELLEIMKKQEEENEKLRQQIQLLTNELQEQKMKFSSVGSLAEAAIGISGIIEAAEKAADIYVNGAKKMYYEQQEAYARYQQKVLNIDDKNRE